MRRYFVSDVYILECMTGCFYKKDEIYVLFRLIIKVDLKTLQNLVKTCDILFLLQTTNAKLYKVSQK